MLKVKIDGEIVTLTPNVINYKETAQCGITEMDFVLYRLRGEQWHDRKLAVGLAIRFLQALIFSSENGGGDANLTSRTGDET